jgi:aspartate carbamoyltransferase catalytic subunit
MVFPHKDLLGITELSPSEIVYILDTASKFKEISSRRIKKVPTLRGKTVVNLFFEPSTRTRASFEIAAKRLSADTINISKSSSSVEKGETLLDTVRTLNSMRPDVVIIRHEAAGAVHFIAQRIQAAVINAGDGWHEHPTQALLDLFTIREHKGRIKGLKVSIIGDILHSRVARSAILGLSKLGAEIRVTGPETLVPPQIESLGAKIFPHLKEGIKDADVIMLLRLQTERHKSFFFIPSLREYSQIYGLNRKNISYAASDVIVMHPGPINRGVEIEPEVADGSRSVILDQVENGVAIRMAVLYLLAGER